MTAAMAYKGLHFLPFGLFILIPLTFLITFTIAVLLDHVEPGFPYISETGTLSPESCVFAQLLNFGAMLLAICVYIKYREVSEKMKNLDTRDNWATPRMNKAAGLLGFLSCLGLDLVANFQQSNVIVVHMIGAMLCFFTGTIYFCLQTWFSYRFERGSTTCTTYARACMSALCIVLTISTIAPGTVALQQYKGSDTMKWTSEDGGWELHVVSTASEWALCIMYCAFILSYVRDFSRISVEPPVVRIIQKN